MKNKNNYATQEANEKTKAMRFFWLYGKTINQMNDEIKAKNIELIQKMDEKELFQKRSLAAKKGAETARIRKEARSIAKKLIIRYE